MVALGHITGVFGLKGWLRVYSYTRPYSGILDYPRWWIKHSDADGGPMEFEAKLLDGRIKADKLIVRISNDAGNSPSSRDDAFRYVGATIYVARSALPPTPDGVYYWVDLVGLLVRTVSGDVLGRVETISDNGAHDVLVVANGEVRQLVPFVVGPIVTKVCLDKGYLVVNWESDF